MSRTLEFWSHVVSSSRILNCQAVESILSRCYTKKARNDGCSRAHVDIPPPVDPNCPQPCERRKKKKEGILHKIKLKVIEGGTNFGTPFRRLECKAVCTEKEPPPKALPEPKKKHPPMPEPRPGVQVSVLGADTAIGQYLALLLKQCSCIKKLRLYEAKDSQGCTRDLCSVVQDLQHINTNCLVQAFSCACYELERCLQNSDIVLILESGYLNVDMPFEKRFLYQAPIVKCYADAIANECPKAFIIVGATPIDCMVPLIAETLKETGWYDPNKLLGSLAVPEMRASTLAARALCLEPRYTRVPCVGGTEGDTLVPLFSKAVEYFDFAQHNAEMMTEAVRNAPVGVSRCDGPCQRAGDLSEAHALAGLVTSVAHALLCHDIPRVTGFVETDLGQVISPARFIAGPVEIGGSGIIRNLGLPKMTDHETTCMNLALSSLSYKQCLVYDWYYKYCSSSTRLDACQFEFFCPKSYRRFDDCAYANV
ncbi:malate dehydrogenase, mitochondrial-like isoform X3 [Spodoptera litura]|uniref:Malate dehydrogenase, mitochondrial n=1 Tax=Spodoptera litura TaxID=69820 RepID=A0A9J7ITG2_SPOLT|nr:malate dehydrogenase, mitochondrial-like isoform X3 [Spodoptera litura]